MAAGASPAPSMLFAVSSAGKCLVMPTLDFFGVHKPCLCDAEAPANPTDFHYFHTCLPYLVRNFRKRPRAGKTVRRNRLVSAGVVGERCRNPVAAAAPRVSNVQLRVVVHDVRRRIRRQFKADLSRYHLRQMDRGGAADWQCSRIIFPGRWRTTIVDFASKILQQRVR